MVEKGGRSAAASQTLISRAWVPRALDLLMIGNESQVAVL